MRMMLVSIAFLCFFVNPVRGREGSQRASTSNGINVLFIFQNRYNEIMRGDTNLKYLADNNVHIWDEWPYKAYLIKNGISVPKSDSEEWKTGLKEFIEKIKSAENFAKEYGNLGPIYGYQWRSWPTPNGGHIDQLAKIIEEIKKNPESRRLIIYDWNVADID